MSKSLFEFFQNQMPELQPPQMVASAEMTPEEQMQQAAPAILDMMAQMPQKKGMKSSVSMSMPMPGQKPSQGYEKEIEELFYKQLQDRNAQVGEMQNERAQLQAQPKTFQDVNLRPALAYADSLVGTNTANSYQAPTGLQDRKALMQRLQEQIMNQEGKMGDDQINYLKAKAQAEADKQRMSWMIGTADQRAQKSGASQEFRLREKWEGHPVTKASQSMDDHYRRITGVPTDTPAGQMSMVFAYMKMLDDGSVVRESEYATAAKTAGLYDRAGLYMDKLKTGQILTEQQINEFRASADSIMGEVREKQGKLDEEYKGLAQAYGYAPERVAYGVGFKEKGPKVGAVEDGHVFKGGNPKDPKNWKPVGK